jgi:hypothetical protein
LTFSLANDGSAGANAGEFGGVMRIVIGPAALLVAMGLAMSPALAAEWMIEKPPMDGFGEQPPPTAANGTAAPAVPALEAIIPAAGPTDPGPTGWVREPTTSFIQDLQALAEMGGVYVYENRYTIAGAAIGCAAGALVGVALTATAGLATGGLLLPVTGEGGWVGCGFGAAVGAAAGYPMDHALDAPQ